MAASFPGSVGTGRREPWEIVGFVDIVQGSKTKKMSPCQKSAS